MRLTSYISILTIIFVNSYKIFSQQPVFEWDSRYTGSPGYEQYIMDVITDSTGNTYVAGYIQMPGQSASKNWLVLKVTYAGIIQWVNIYNGSANAEDMANSIKTDRFGSIYVTGYTTSGTSSVNLITVKYSKNGDTLWTREFDAAGYIDQGKDISVDNDGNVYVTGYAYFPGDNSDIATVKYDSSGNFQWARYYGGSGNLPDFGNSIVVDNNKDIVVTGTIRRNLSTFDVVIIKYNPSGDTIWNKLYQGVNQQGADIYGKLKSDNNNNYYFLGATVGTHLLLKYNVLGDTIWVKGLDNDLSGVRDFCFDRNNNFFVTGVLVDVNNRSDIAVAKYNNQAELIWKRQYPNSAYQSSDQGVAVVCDRNGNVYIAGYNDSLWIANDYLTVKYDSLGSLKWAKRYSFSLFTDDKASFIGLDSSMNIYVTGISSGQITTIKYTQHPLGITAIGNEIPAEYKLYQNYPNPFNPTTIIRFQIIRLSDLKLAVYNVQGKQITELVNGKYSTGTYEIEWDASDYPSGIYFYYIQAGSFTDTKKMVLIK